VKQNEQSRNVTATPSNTDDDNLGEVTHSITPPMTDDSCGCSQQSHYGLRLVIRLNVFDCYGRGDFGTGFFCHRLSMLGPVLAPVLAPVLGPVRRRVPAVSLSLA
jgi:hypothetical protein